MDPAFRLREQIRSPGSISPLPIEQKSDIIRSWPKRPCFGFIAVWPKQVIGESSRGVREGVLIEMLSFLKGRMFHFVHVYLYPCACPRNTSEVCQKSEGSGDSVGITRPLDDKTLHLDTRRKLASFENRHHESNWACSEGKAGAAVRAAGSPAASKKTVEHPTISSISIPPIRQKIKIR